MTSPIAQFKNFWGEIPPVVQKFLIRALLIFLVWKISYHTYLKPNRIIDNPLTEITTNSTIKLLSAFYPSDLFTTIKKIPINKIDFGGMDIYRNGKKIIGILDPCNGLEVFVTFFIFILSFPNTFTRAFTFILLGVAMIFILNIIRCSVIAYLNIKQSAFTDIAHHYIFNIVVYGCILALWALYVNKKENEKSVG